MTLASERAVTDAFLLSGDEDLREGVKAAQDRGVRLVLLGIETVAGFNQSRELVEEADELVTLTKANLAPIIKLRPVPTPVAGPSGTPAPTLPLPSTAGVVSGSPTEAGRDYAEDWIANATPGDVQGLIAVHPRIPRTLDIELLRFVEGAVGHSLHGDDQAHREVRKSFWMVVRPTEATLRSSPYETETAREEHWNRIRR